MTTRPSPSRCRSLASLERLLTSCRLCPRLVAHREAIARVKRRAFRDEVYWGRPVPGFGDTKASLLVLGLAPAAHGGNRTGRVFTGDSSGDWLYEALHRFGFASQPTSAARDDGLRLSGAYVSAAARCAPPGNRPTPEELRRCRPHLEAEFRLIPMIRLVLALGAIAWETYLGLLRDRGVELPTPRPRFAHLAELDPESGGPRLLGCYHPSRQNTQTGRLTRPQFHAAFRRAREILGE